MKYEIIFGAKKYIIISMIMTMILILIDVDGDDDDGVDDDDDENENAEDNFAADRYSSKSLFSNLALVG